MKQAQTYQESGDAAVAFRFPVGRQLILGTVKRPRGNIRPRLKIETCPDFRRKSQMFEEDSAIWPA
jgi:hypothetical protein